MTPNRILLFVIGAVVVLASSALLVRAIGGKLGQHASGPNILLVTFDTTRADHIGAYGWPHGRTPALDQLSEQGVLFTRAVAPVPLTLPSHAVMMTGMYPFYIDVRDNSHFRLDDQATTLAETLRDHGYHTGAVVAAFVLDARFGLDQGFDEYRDDIPAGAQFAQFQIPERNAQQIADDALDWLQKTDKDRPFFLWCHFYDPHHPYETPESFPFYLGNAYDLEIAFADYHFQRLLDYLEQQPDNQRPTLTIVAGDHGEALGEYGEETHGYFVYESTLHVPLMIKLPDKSRSGAKIDTPVSLVDLMPTILDLAGLPVPGEDQIHGRSLAGLIRGEAASREAFRQRPIYFECYMSLYDFGWAPVRGVRVDQRKFIESPIPELYLLDENPREGWSNNVYPLHVDVGRQLSDKLRAVVDAPLRRPRLSGDVGDVDPEVIQNLLALGYLTGTAAEEREWGPEDDVKNRLPLHNLILAAVSQRGAGELAASTATLQQVLERDPENPRALWVLAEAVAADPEEAAAGLPILETAARNTNLEPAMRAQFLLNCGRTYLIKQDPQRALTYFTDAVSLQPDNPIGLGWLGVAHLHLGNVAEALRVTREALRHASDSSQLQVQLGLLEFCDGQTAAAAQRWNKLLALENEPVSPWTVASMCARDPVIAARVLDPCAQAAADRALAAPVRAALHATVGQILISSGRFESALDAFQATAALLGQEDALVLWWQARAWMGMERLEEAVSLLERACQLNPDEILVVVDLANAYHKLNRVADALARLTTFHESHPDDPTAANNLAWMLCESEQTEENLEHALSLAKFAVRRRRASSAFHDTLGWVHLKRGEGRLAAHSFTRAARLDPRDGTYQYHLGLAYRLDDEHEKAREAFTRALELAATARPDWYQDAVAGSQQ